MARAPIATYRLQLTGGWGFEHARGVLDYLAKLGVSHLYLSPIFQARPGSRHGYDQTDPTRVRDELGGEAALRRLAAEAHSRGMGILIDIVPNHLAAHHDNPWWWRMLAEGPTSPAAAFFDVDWSTGRIVLPVLGRPLPEVLAAAQITVAPGAAGPELRYFQHRFPLRADDCPPDATPSLHLLARQHYELAEWRDGLRRINYRRFFDIADLAGVRVEDPAVFQATHAGVFRLADAGLIDGVRVDHVDGLLDPKQYLRRLRLRLNQCSGGRNIFVLVEKILGIGPQLDASGCGERLPDDWPVDGTTGYEFAAATAQLAAPAAGVSIIREHAVTRAHIPPHFARTAVDAKRFVARELFAAELDRLTGQAATILQDLGHTGLDSDRLRTALVEVSAHLPVYRTYADRQRLTPRDRRLLEGARDAALDAARDADAEIRAIAALLLGQSPFDDAPGRHAATDLRLRWQQFTGPLAAKGIEDTALYRDTAFLALNEVGCEPEPCPDARRLVEQVLTQRHRWPCSLNAASTHDTKRGEDARVRLAALAMVPQRWNALTNHWLAASPGDPPDPAEKLLIHQTIWSIWPEARRDPADAAARLDEYLGKALREAKVHSSWAAPDEAYEQSAARYTRHLLLHPDGAAFRADLDALEADLGEPSTALSILLVLLRTLAPGVPDIYQGAALWERSLVDPDNRRAVDFDLRRRKLNRLLREWERDPHTLAARAPRRAADGDLKLFVLVRAVRCRRWLLEPGAPLALDSLDVRHVPGGRILAWRASAGQRAVAVACAVAQPGLRSLAPDDRRAVWRPPDGFEAAIDQLAGQEPASDATPAARIPAAVFLRNVQQLLI